MRGVVFDWENHPHRLTKRVLHKGMCGSDDEDGEVCFVCTTAAEQHELTAVCDLGRHPEDCKCWHCARYPAEVAKQRAAIKEAREHIPF